jgi:glutathione S-transferase
MFRYRGYEPSIRLPEDDLLELYYYENSICAERPLMAFEEKGINDWTRRHVHLFKGEQFSPEYLKLNPKAVVPTLVHDGHIIRESAIISDYIDDLSSINPLKPAALVDVATMREWVKDSDDYVFEAVGVLSFVSVFRAKMLAMSHEERGLYWERQTVIDRTLRQMSCVKHGLDSPYVLRAIAAWERTFTHTEEALADGRPWLMGEQFTLADLCYAPFLARISGLMMIDVWLENRPLSRAWWERIRTRDSFIRANVGPTADERVAYAAEGTKSVPDLRERLNRYRKRAMALWDVV